MRGAALILLFAMALAEKARSAANAITGPAA